MTNDPIEDRLGLDRPEREDDRRDGVPEWQRFKTYPTFNELIELARRKMAPDTVKAEAEREAERQAQAKDRLWTQR